MSGLGYEFGVRHLGGETFKSLAKVEFESAVGCIEKGEAIRAQLIDTYNKISKILYNER